MAITLNEFINVIGFRVDDKSLTEAQQKSLNSLQKMQC